MPRRPGRAVAAVIALIVGIGVAGAESPSRTLPVPSVTIYPGDLLEDSVIEERSFRRTVSADAYAPSRAALAGKIARRTLLPHRPIPLNALEDVALVRRGVPVQLVFQYDGLFITAFAAPLQDGRAGELIRARNADSGAIVTGVVQPDGTVRVGPQ